MSLKASKLILTALLALFLALPLAACGGGSGVSVESEEPAQETEQATTGDQAATDQEAAPEEQAADAKYAVTIDGAQLTTDYDGKPAAIVTYTFTNNSDEEESFATACSADVYQNGVECQMAMGVEGDYDSGTYMQKVQPGATNQVQLAYQLQDTSPIDVKVEELFNFEDVVLAEKTINLE